MVLSLVKFILVVHSLNIFHGDVKAVRHFYVPFISMYSVFSKFGQENVIIFEDEKGGLGVVKACLGDFGLSKLQNTPNNTTGAHYYTRSHQAPEMLSKTLYPNAMSDVYALGCLTIEVWAIPITQREPTITRTK